MAAAHGRKRNSKCGCLWRPIAPLLSREGKPMKGWTQLMQAAARDLLAEVKRVAPESPVAIRAETIFEVAEETGIKPSGRPPNAAGNERRETLMQRIAERDATDKEVAKLYASGLSLMEVGRRTGGHSTAWVTASLARTGTPTRPRGNNKTPPNLERIERMRAYRAEGKTLEEIAAVEHISRERVRQICNSAGISTSPSSELTPEQHAAVEEYLAGGSLNLVSARYGVGSHALRNWVMRAGHVPRREPTRRSTAETKRRAERAAQLYRQGMKADEIAKALGFKKGEAIYRFLAIAGVKPDRQPTSGRHGLQQ